jgi:membrane-bound metal-dependent hydrolase YbcI (DUF457 family)
MDPITHVITGALLGKAYFSEREYEPKGRVAVLAVTFGALFPDVDIFFEVLSRDPLAIAKIHRGFTHSFVGLPLFAGVLTWLTRWLVRRIGRECPSTAVLFAAYAVGIASHIVLDGMTSFGTRMWMPISNARVAWDLLFIIDLSLTALVLLPQVAAWVYRIRARHALRAAGMWAFFSLAALGAWKAAQATGFPYSPWGVVVTSLLLAALLFIPSLHAWGFGVARTTWCRAGVYVMLAYLVACGIAHHAALDRVKTFAEANQLAVERMGALPIPPSLLDWTGLIRANDGVYSARFDLRDSQPPVFESTADSAPNRYIATARELPDVRRYLSFARFPMIHFEQLDGRNIVEFSDLRFFNRRSKRPSSFTFKVVFDSEGKVLEEGWTGALTYPHRQREDSPSTESPSK